MDRRIFLKASALALPAVSWLPTAARAAASDQSADAWRIFEVTTRVEVQKPAGRTRVWLPVPLTQDTDYQKSLGNNWSAETAGVSFVRDPKYGAGIVAAEFAEGAVPTLQLVSRFAARDRDMDLSVPTNPAPLSKAEFALYTAATELLPTDGIVRDTAREIIGGAKGEVEKSRAIYEWIVENTFRDPKVRGCGVGDIRFMLESRNLGGKCADLNALFVGLARSVGRAGARCLWRTRGRFPARLKSLGKSRRHHQGAALPRRVLVARARLGAGRSRRRAQGGAGRKARHHAGRRSAAARAQDAVRRLGDELAGLQLRPRPGVAGCSEGQGELLHVPVLRKRPKARLTASTRRPSSTRFRRAKLRLHDHSFPLEGEGRDGGAPPESSCACRDATAAPVSPGRRVLLLLRQEK